MSGRRSFRPGVRVWPLPALALAALLAVPPTGGTTTQLPRPVAVQSWLAAGSDEGSGGSSGGGGSDSGGSDSGGDAEVSSGPDTGHSDDSGGDSGGGAPEVESKSKDSSSGDSSGEDAKAPDVQSDQKDKPSDDSSGGDGKAPEVRSGPKDDPSDNPNGGDKVDVAPGAGDDRPGSSSGDGGDAAIPEMVKTTSTSDGTSGDDGGIPEFIQTGDKAPDRHGGSGEGTPATIDRPASAPADGNSGSGSGGATDPARPGTTTATGQPAQDGQPAGTTDQPAVAEGQPAGTGQPGQPGTVAPAAPADPAQAARIGNPPAGTGQPGQNGEPIPDNLRNLFAPTGNPGDQPGGAPDLPAKTLLGEGNDPATGQAFYRNLLTSEGAGADRLRSLDQSQIDQLAGQGPPRTAENAIDLATGIPAAAPGTVQEYDRNEALRTWFEKSREHPADFDAFAGALPPGERAKLEQQFEAYKPGDISQKGGLSYWGRQASDFLRDFDKQAAQDNPSNFTPGSWPDRIERSGNKFFEDIPEGLATSFEHLLREDPSAELTNGGDPYYQPLAGESPEHLDQRIHPFSQDLRAMGQSYSDDVKPIITDGDWSKLGQHFYDDPVGAAAAYAPIGGGAAKLAGKAGPLAESAITRLRGSPGPRRAETRAADGAVPAAGATEETTARSGGPTAAARGPEARAPGTAGSPSAGAADTAETAPLAGARPGPVGAEPGVRDAGGDAAIKALERGDDAALGEALAPRPVSPDTASELRPDRTGRAAGPEELALEDSGPSAFRGGTPSWYGNSGFRSTATDRAAFRDSYPAYGEGLEKVNEFLAKNPQFSGIPKEDLAGIWGYTTDDYHGFMNQALREGDQGGIERFQPNINTATSGLNQLPPYQGTVHRGMTISPGDLKSVEQRYKPGEVVTENQFVSTDTERPFGGNVTFEIESLTGRDIKDLSSYGDSESEVLFAPGTPFQVVDRTNQDGALHIKLREIGK